MNTEYIDVSDIKRKQAGAYISRIAAAKNPVLVFMPNLDYAGMHDAEALASNFNIGFLNIPITLPMLDLVKQMEFAGVHVTQQLVSGIESAFRLAVIEQMNGEEEYFEHEGIDSGQDRA